MNKLLFMLLFPALFSCQTQTAVTDAVDVDLEHKVSADVVAGMFEMTDIVPLKAGSVSISDITKTCVADGRIYVLDYLQKRILAVDLDSNVVSVVINNIGSAKNEYVKITDFAVDRKGNIFVLDGSSRKIIVYDKCGKHKKTIHSVGGNAIAVADNGNIGLHTLLVEDGENMRVLSSGGKKKVSVPCVDNVVRHSTYNGNELIAVGNDFYFCNPFDFNVYKVAEKNDTAIARFDFGRREVDVDKVRAMNTKEFVEFYRRNTQVTSIENLCMYDGRMFFSTTKADQIVFDVETQSAVCLSNMEQPYGVSFSSPLIVGRNGFFYVFVSENNVKNALVTYVTYSDDVPEWLRNVAAHKDSTAQYWLLKGRIVDAE